jgi:hypothetical protein
MAYLDYAVPAQLCYPRRPGKWAPLSFDRFETNAETIQHAVERRQI